MDELTPEVQPFALQNLYFLLHCNFLVAPKQSMLSLPKNDPGFFYSQTRRRLRSWAMTCLAACPPLRLQLQAVVVDPLDAIPQKALKLQT